jgi:1,4-alpha-glucan branching enzyme/maltooligosyltrehalose trehalohydrolase
MGEEWGCRQPFLFFCDFGGELGEAVRNGRREEFKRFAAFRDPAARERIPDPLAESTFRQCVLRWDEMDQEWLSFHKTLLGIRQKEIATRTFRPGKYAMLAQRAFQVTWPAEGGGTLRVLANCGDAKVATQAQGRVLYSSGTPGAAWTVNWFLS